MIEVRTEGSIAVIVMNHGKANALDIEFCDTLAAGFVGLRKSDAGAIVLTAQARIFSAGVDLKQLSAGGEDYVRKFLPSLHRLYDAVFFHPKPVVMAVNGHAMAGGAVLAACGDRRIMAANSGRIGITEMLVGVPLPALAFEIVRFAVPPRYLAEFALTGATYPTADALHKGWIDEVVEPGALMTRAMEAARFYAALSPAAFAQTKTQVRQSVSERMALSGAATDRTVTKIWTESATLDRVAAYVAKTLSKA